MQRARWGQWKRLQPKKIALLLLCGGISAFLFLCLENRKKPLEELIVVVDEPFTTFDPIEFDQRSLQPIQGIVNIKLFSNFKDAKLQPELAESWSSENSAATWKFKIREDVTFDDGTPLTIEDVVRSLQRIAFLSKQKGSRNGFIENLKGISALEAAYSPSFPGISHNEGSLVIELNRPVPNLPDLLSFGLYAIVKSTAFDSTSGKWTAESSSFHGAGPYKAERIGRDEMIFRLKNRYPAELYSNDPFTKIVFRIGSANWKNADIFLGAKDQLKVPNKLTFQSAGESSIRYFLIHSWKKKRGPLSSEQKRMRFRQFFYDELKSRGYVAVKSFFPKILNGINEVYTEPLKPSNSKGKEAQSISFVDFRPMSTKNSEAAVDAIEAAIKRFGCLPVSKKNVSFEDAQNNKDYDRKNFIFDIAFYSTEISLIDPKQDVKLMFSPSGLNLPDSTGEIKKELESSDFSIQKVNELLMKQSIVIPAFHAEQGIWASRKVDFRRYNTSLLLGELQWLTVSR